MYSTFLLFSNLLPDSVNIVRNNKKLKQITDSFIDFRRHSSEISKGSEIYNKIVEAINMLLNNPRTCIVEIEKIFCNYIGNIEDNNCNDCDENCCTDLASELYLYVKSKREEIKTTLLQEEEDMDLDTDSVFPSYVAVDEVDAYLSSN